MRNYARAILLVAVHFDYRAREHFAAHTPIKRINHTFPPAEDWSLEEKQGHIDSPPVADGWAGAE